MDNIWLYIIGGAMLLLMFQRWFWIVAFGIGGLASLFGLLASIIHFQILAALGLFFLMIILWGAASMVAEGLT